MSSAAGEPAARRVSTVPRRRSRALLPTILVLVVLLMLFGVFTGYYTDWLWFRSVGYTQVFARELGTKSLLFVLFGALTSGAVVANFVLAYRSRPAFPALTPNSVALERYRTAVEPFRRPLVLGAALLFGLIAASSAAAQWQTYLLWRNGVGFGRRDPQFNVDVAYYAFTLPWWRFVLSFLFTVLVISLGVALATHYLYGGLRLQGEGERTTPAARVHISALLGFFLLAKAAAYWLDRYSLLLQDDTVGNRPFTGLTYTDANAVLQSKNILWPIALICALLFFANFVWRTWLLPALGVGGLLAAAVLVGSIWPEAVQYFRVRPAEATREAQFIKHNIDATREAYGIADAEVIEYEGATTPDAQQVATQIAQPGQDIPGIRLLDPQVVAPTFKQLQQVRQYYGFNDSLDVDRYRIGGQLTDVVVAVREIDRANQPPNFFNDHLAFTHGFGLVAARGDTREPDGRPVFVESNIPPTGELGEFEPRVYYGETSPVYSIAGGLPGGRNLEVDFPDDTAPGGQRNNTYQGRGGVPVGSLVNRLLYAVKFQEESILLSGDINPASRILYDRRPRERVQKVAPWLTLDGDPYPAVVDGRIQWILDGYTTTAGYPYAQHTPLRQASTDTLARTTAVADQANQQVNYLRNSVKATVDAYDGTVNLYAWDEGDPVLRAWRSAFPGTVKGSGEIPESLRSHLRYPQDLFKIQRNVLAQYHVLDPGQFYSGFDFWQVPKDPTSQQQNSDQPPYYLTVQVPGQPQPRFSLTTTFVLRERPNLAAFAAVVAEPGEGYGRLRVLRTPTNTTIAGPVQAFNAFQADPEVSSELNLLSRGGSQVKFGNLLTLPVGGGFLYVEPVYVQAEAAGTNAFPLLQRVRVSFGNRIGFAETLPAALTDVFGGEPPPSPVEDPVEPPPGASPSPPAPGGPSAPGRAERDLERALADARTAVGEAEAALRRNDFAAYGTAQQKLRDAINRASAAQGRARPGASASPSASGSPSPGAAPPGERPAAGATSPPARSTT